MHQRKWRWVVHIVCLAVLAWMTLVGVSYQRLRGAREFGAGGVGMAATITEEENATRILMTQPFAIPILAALCADESVPWGGRLYALWGLKQCSQREFDTCQVPFLRSKATLHTWQGCVGGEEKVADVAGRIQRGE